MIIKHRDLINISDFKRYDIHIDSILFENDILVKEISNLKGYLEFFYDTNDTLCFDYDIECDIKVPGSLSPDDVIYSDRFEGEEEVTFDELKEGFFIKDNTCDIDIIKNIVIPNIPLKAPDTSENLHIEGDGWTITSEKEYAKISKIKEDTKED